MSAYANRVHGHIRHKVSSDLVTGKQNILMHIASGMLTLTLDDSVSVQPAAEVS